MQKLNTLVRYHIIVSIDKIILQTYLYINLFFIGFGLKNLTGNIDFFPNGGFQQPRCEKKKALYRLFKKGFVDGNFQIKMTAANSISL